MVLSPGLSGQRTTLLRHAALLLVDLQNAFFEEDPLAVRRLDLTRCCNQLIHWARASGLPILNVRTEHRSDRSTWTLNMIEDDQGFLLQGDHDAQPLPGLDLDGVRSVVKTRDSAFVRTSLGDLLARLGVRSLVLAGVSTHTCIAATAADAYAHDLHVVLAEQAIASHRPELHRPTLDTLADEYRLQVLRHQEIIVARERARPE